MRRSVRTDETVTEAVLLAIAEIEGADPGVQSEALHTLVDPDALNVVFGDRIDGTPRTGGRVTFTYGQYQVIVDGGRRIAIFD